MGPKELYDALHGDGLYTKDFDSFMAKYGNPEGQAQLHSNLNRDGLYTKDFSSFQSKYFPEQPEVKKKVSGNASTASSFAQPIATTAGNQLAETSVSLDWSTGEVKQNVPVKKAMGPTGVSKSPKLEFGFSADDASIQEPMTYRYKGEIALEEMESRIASGEDAVAANRDKIEAQGRRMTIGMEKNFMAEQEKDKSIFEPQVEQANTKEYSTMTQAVVEDNRNIDLSIAQLDNLSKLDPSITGISPEELSNKKDALLKLREKNIERFKAELATGRYDDAQKYADHLQEVQQKADEDYKKKGGVEKAIANAGKIGLHSVAKFYASVGSIADVAEKAVGMEGGTPGFGDKIQETLMAMGDDTLNALPAPTSLQRGAFTTSADWGDKQVDFDANGEIASIRDKDGFVVNMNLTKEQEQEIKALEKGKKFRGASFAYQVGGTLADVMLQIGAVKALSSAKIIPGMTASRMGVGLKMTTMSPEVAMTIVNAGMMSSDLYQEGLDNMDGDEDAAARYALGTGVGIGAVSSMLGLGAESQWFKTGVASRIAEPVFGKGVAGAIGRNVYGFAKGGLGEAIEEVGTEKLTQAGGQIMANNLAGASFDPNQWKDKNAIMTEAATAFMTGGLVNMIKGPGSPKNNLQRDLLIEGARNREATVEAVREVAAAVGQALDEAEETSLIAQLESTRQALDLTPVEHQGDMEIMAMMEERVKVGQEISGLKDELKDVDEAFSQDKRDKLESLEKQRAELSRKISEKANVKPSEKDATLLEEAGGDGGEEVKVKAETTPEPIRADMGVEIIPPPEDVQEAPQGVSINNFDDLLANDAARLSISEDGKAIEFEEFDVTIDRESMTAEVNFIKKKKRTENKGIGERSYIELGKRLKEQGITLTSTQTKLVGGHKVWEALEKKGYAKRVSSGMYEFTIPTETTQATAEPQINAEPAAPQPVTPTDLTPGETYTNKDRDYKFIEEKDGILYFEKVAKPGETLMTTKVDVAPDSIFMKGLTQNPIEIFRGEVKDNKESVASVFEKSEELSKIGSIDDYNEYVDTIFPESKVKEVVYHGSHEDFSEFDVSKIGSKASALYGQGFYFSRRNDKRFQDRKHVKISLLNLKNPRIYKEGNITKFQNPDIDKWHLSSEFDGVVLPMSEDIAEYVVFDPKNIHVLGSPKDVKDFMDWKKTKTESVLNAQQTGSKKSESKAPPVPPAPEPTAPKIPEQKRSKFEREDGSMGKAEAAGARDKVHKEIADENPAMYEVMDRQGTRDEAERFVKEKGAEAAAKDMIARAAKERETFSPGNQAKRIVAVLELQRIWAQQAKAGDPKAAETRKLIAQVQNDIASLGTQYGQENESLKMWQESPAGVVASAIAKVENVATKSKNITIAPGQTVEQAIDAFVADLKTTMTEQEVQDVVSEALSKYAPAKAAKERIKEGKKELNSALAKLRKSTAGKTSAGVGISKEQGKALLDVFRAVAKIAKGNVDQMKLKFKEAVGQIVDADAAWKYMEDNHKDTLDAAKGKGNVDMLAALAKERARIEEQLQKERMKAEKGTKDTANKLAIKKAQDEIKRLKEVEKQVRERALRDLDSDAMEAALRGKVQAGELASAIPEDLAKEFGIPLEAAQRIVDGLTDTMSAHIEKTRADEIRKMIKKNLPKATKKAARSMEEKLIRAMSLGGLRAEPLQKQIAEFYGVREFSPEEVAMFAQIITGSENLPGDKLKMERQLEILDYIKTEITGESKADLAIAFWYSGALSGPSTHLKNTIGNIALLEDLFVRGLGSLAMKAIKPSESGGTITGIKNIAREFWTVQLEVARIMGTGRGSRDFDKFSTSPAMERFSKGKISPSAKGALTAYAKLLRYSPRLMKSTDALFYGISNSFMRGQQAVRQAKNEGFEGDALDARVKEILDGTMDNVRAAARQELIDSGVAFTELDVKIRAQERMVKSSEMDPERRADVISAAERNTLVNPPYGMMGALVQTVHYAMQNLMSYTAKHDTVIDGYAPKLQPIAKGLAKGMSKFFEIIFPFLRTAANLTNKAVDYIPVVPLVTRGAEGLMFGFGPDSKVNRLAVPNWQSVDEVINFGVRQATGAALMGTLMSVLDWEDEDGIKLTANISDDFEKVRQAKEVGIEPWTIAWTDKDGGKHSWMYRDYPFAGAMALIGSRMDAARFGDTANNSEEQATYQAHAMIAYFSDAAMLRSFSDAVGFVDSHDMGRLRNMATRPISGFLKPGWARHIENLVSPESRKSYNKGDDFAEKIGYSILANTVITDKLFFNVSRNAIGDPISPDSPPWYRGLGLEAIAKWDPKPTPIIQKMVEKGVFFGKVPRPTLFGMEADDTNFEKFVHVVGRYRKYRLKDELDKIEASAPESIKKALRYDITANANKVGKVLVFENEPEVLTDEFIISQMNDANVKQILKRYKKYMKDFRLTEEVVEDIKFD